MIKVRVSRYDPEVDQAPHTETYEVPAEEKGTVLGALLHIYEHADPTLAFRSGCRFLRCGLCAVEVNNSPRVACITRLREGMTIKPLHNVNTVRDLVADRSWIMDEMRRWQMWVPDARVPQVFAPPEMLKLAECTECMSCTSTCPSWRQGMETAGGPLHFVKLAQLHHDPRDATDRRAQARALGIARCADCLKCRCVLGIPIVEMAIRPLLGG